MHSPALTAASEVSDIHAALPQTLRIAMDSEPAGCSPWPPAGRQANGRVELRLGLVFEPLLRYVPGSDGTAAAKSSHGWHGRGGSCRAAWKFASS